MGGLDIFEHLLFFERFIRGQLEKASERDRERGKKREKEQAREHTRTRTRKCVRGCVHTGGNLEEWGVSRGELAAYRNVTYMIIM